MRFIRQGGPPDRSRAAATTVDSLYSLVYPLSFKTIYTSDGATGRKEVIPCFIIAYYRNTIILNARTVQF